MEIYGVTESLVQHLREHIIAGILRPGQRLNEVELSSALGTSRSPLREAFRVLVNEHLVDVRPRKGSFVTDVSIQDCQEIFETREMLECFSISQLKLKKIRKLPEVSRALDATSKLTMPKTDDPGKKFAYLKKIADFHIKLVEAAGNSKLTAFHRSIFPSLARYQSFYVFIEGLMEKSQYTHEEVLALIGKGRYAEATKVLQNHIRYWPKLLTEKMMQGTSL